MLKVAILGANGFIGSRAVEILHLRKLAEVRPVVRKFSSLARSARFALDWRIADAFDRSALSDAFSGSDVVLDAIVGDARTITETVEPVYKAACECGVRRLIYLSSAAVHGQAPGPGTDERTPLSSSQPLPYNRAKVTAERKLMALRAAGKTEVIILRPGIVFGPRSRWTAGIADELLSGTAYLLDQGRGVCNSIYVDNLIEAIRLSLTTVNIDREAFLVADAERVTWADLYLPIAQALGVPADRILKPVAPQFRTTWKDLLQAARSSPLVQRALPVFPAPLKRSVKAALAAFEEKALPSAWAALPDATAAPTMEMAMLQQCKYKLPADKAREVLGYEPVVSFDEGCRRSVGWLRFAGYPVVGSDD